MQPIAPHEIDKAISVFLADESAAPECERHLALSLRIVPALIDWSAFAGLAADGTIVWVDYEQPHHVYPIDEERIRNIVLFNLSQCYDHLSRLCPVMPDDAQTCRACHGTGEYTIPGHFVRNTTCYCGGLGWLPHGCPAF